MFYIFQELIINEKQNYTWKTDTLLQIFLDRPLSRLLLVRKQSEPPFLLIKWTDTVPWLAFFLIHSFSLEETRTPKSVSSSQIDSPHVSIFNLATQPSGGSFSSSRHRSRTSHRECGRDSRKEPCRHHHNRRWDMRWRMQLHFGRANRWCVRNSFGHRGRGWNRTWFVFVSTVVTLRAFELFDNLEQWAKRENKFAYGSQNQAQVRYCTVYSDHLFWRVIWRWNPKYKIWYSSLGALDNSLSNLLKRFRSCAFLNIRVLSPKSTCKFRRFNALTRTMGVHRCT